MACTVGGCDNKVKSKGLCSKHIWRLSINGTTDETVRMLSEKERFWHKVDKGEDSDCWEWLAYIGTSGYGRFRSEHGDLAHRYSYAIHNNINKDFKSKLVLHSCDNRKCVNPNHLSLGSHQDNSNDAKSRNRFPKERVNSRGEKSCRSKLTEKQVIGIYQAIGTYKDIAAQYKTNVSSVADIRCERRWKATTKNIERGIYELGHL